MSTDPIQAISSQVDLDPGVEFHALRVLEVLDETHDARSFVLEIPPELEGAFRYQAGQFLTFRIPWEGFEITRCYSLASSPDTGELPKFTVKRISEGRASNWFNDQVRAGSTLEVRPPAGRFVLRSSEAPIAMFGGGSGITPVISLIKTALLHTTRRLKLVYANRDARSIIFRDELERLAREHPERLELVHHLDEESGFLTPAALSRLLRGWESADAYVCGPTPFMDAVELALESAGIDRSRTFIERFVSASDPDRRPAAEPRDDAAAGMPAGEAAGAEAPTSFQLVLEGETHEVPYLAGKTLLECAREAGLDPPFSCEEGYCSCCMAKLTQGDVQMAVNDALSHKDVAEGWVLTCQSRPTSSQIRIDYDF